jgi:hypothetical protein
MNEFWPLAIRRLRIDMVMGKAFLLRRRRVLRGCMPWLRQRLRLRMRIILGGDFGRRWRCDLDQRHNLYEQLIISTKSLYWQSTKNSVKPALGVQRRLGEQDHEGKW